MSDDYEQHRQRQMAAARDAFAAFVARLPSDKRAMFVDAQGKVEVPKDDFELANGHDKDVAELPQASYRIDMAAEVDSFADTLCETFGLAPEVARLLAAWMEDEVQKRAMSYRASDINNISGVFIDTKNPRLFSAGLAFAADLSSLNGLGTQAQFARKIGLTRAAVSKTTKFWQRLLNLPPSAHMKSEEACRKYAETGKADHWRNRRVNHSEKSVKAMQKLNEKYR